MINTVFYSLLLAIIFIVLLVYGIRQRIFNRHLQKSSNQLFSLLSASKDAIMILEDDDKITFINDAMSTLLRLGNSKKILFESRMPTIYTKDDKQNLKEFVHNHYKPSYNELAYYPHVYIETRMVEKLAVDLYLGSILTPASKKEQLIIIMHDLREAFKEIVSGERVPLTLLPNRTKAFQDFQKLCAGHHIKEQPIALMAISIDGFLTIQSMIGHEEADKTIQEVGKVLKQISLLHKYSLYHSTYSNFLLIFPYFSSNEDLYRVAKTIQHRISALYKEHRSTAYLTASIGISISSESGEHITTMFDKSHQALMEARKYGTGNIHLYKKVDIRHPYDESALQHDIQFAIEREELMIYYQPIVEARTHAIIGAEALMRWKHHELGMIPPFLFIPIMEKTGFIIEAGRYLIREVISQQARWKHYGFEQILLSLNASLKEIELPDYTQYISKQLKEHNVAPNSIKVEITESLGMENIDIFMEYLTTLRRAGISLSLDDFGTGYTSFSYLTKIPASTLKIDKSFVDNILTDEKSQQVVRAIIEVGHALEMDIVAEGVETVEMANLLTDYGCDYLQGYFFSKPIPAYELQGSLEHKEDQQSTDTEEIIPLSVL